MNRMSFQVIAINKAPPIEYAGLQYTPCGKISPEVGMT